MSERPKKQTLLSSPGAGLSPEPAVRFEDAVLVERVRDGDVEAYTTLVTRYQDRVYNTCFRMCGNAEDAADLTQEAFFRAYQGIGTFHGRSGFYTWLFRIAVNLVLSHRRKAKYRKATSLERRGSGDQQAESLRDRLADPRAAMPEERAVAADLRHQVERALETLDEDHRTVIVLRDLEGFDYAEIARILEVATGTVKSRLHRARAAMHTLLAPYVENGG